MTLDDSIRRRGVFYIGGYDPKTPEAFFERLDRERARYERLWGVETGRGAIADRDGVAISTVRASGRSADGGWSVETDLHFFSLEAIVQRDFADPIWTRLGRYLVTFADYVASGSMFAFFRTNWRFAGYFLYPFVMAVLIAVATIGPLWWLGDRIGDEPGELVGLVAGVALFLLVLAKVAPRWYVPHLMDLWSFSRNWIRRQRPDARALFDRYGRVTAHAAREGGYDEIVLVGHSTGGALILEIAHAALEADPAFATAAPRVTLLTVGSTALKIGLHPAAGHFRNKVQALHDAGLSWVEYQSLTDIINFEGTDPAAEMKIDRTNPDFGRAQRVRIRSMLEPATYRRIRRNPFRVHYQFVFANTVRYHYDFHSICFGPIPLLERARNPALVVEHLAPA